MGRPAGSKNSGSNGGRSKSSGNGGGRSKSSGNSGGRKKPSSSGGNRKKPSKSGIAPENILLAVVMLAAVGIGIMFYLRGEKPIEQPIDIVEARPPEETGKTNISTTPTPTPASTPTPTPTPSATPEETEKPDDSTSVTIHKVGLLDLPENITSPYGGNYGSPFDSDGVISNKKLGWYFNRNSNHQPPTAQKDFDIRTLNGYYLGDISQKVVYLTFDEGYENGYSGKILDTLLEKNVKAAFFVTMPYIKSQPELVMRMINEGHLVCNHSVNHQSSPDLTNEKLENEIKELESYFEQATGAKMAKFFRPPMGEYSARTLAVTDNLGYKSIFWSFAYQDWLTDQQPGADVAYKTVMNNLHNGAIILLHAVSESNTQALPDIIDSIREQGYEFGSLEGIGS